MFTTPYLSVIRVYNQFIFLRYFISIKKATRNPRPIITETKPIYTTDTKFELKTYLSPLAYSAYENRQNRCAIINPKPKNNRPAAQRIVIKGLLFLFISTSNDDCTLPFTVSILSIIFSKKRMRSLRFAYSSMVL